MKINIEIRKDDEADVYFATSNDVGLAVEAKTLDELLTEIRLALPELLQWTTSKK